MSNLQMQTLYSRNDILNVLLNNESIYIYGAGRLAKEVVLFLREYGFFSKVPSLLVTERNCNPPKYLGIDVCSYDDANVARENLVIVAINLYSVLDVIELLKKNSYTKIALLSSNLIEEFLKGQKQSYLPSVLNFSVALTDHCNMNCRNCHTFSPIADEKFLDSTEYRKDLKRLSEIFDEECGVIQLDGGEPLLHPQLMSIIKETKENFDIGNIKLFTNGLLLDDVEENLWEIFHEYDVEIILNKYTLACRDDILKKKAEIYDIKYQVIDYAHSNFRGEISHNYGISEQLLLDIGGRSAELNFSYCPYAARVPRLKRGKLYKCSLPAVINRINKYYDLNFHVSELDYVDIYKEESSHKILDRLSKPLPFCRYCRTNHIIYDIPWSVSKKEKREWVIEE